MSVIAVFSVKGGVGKTTVATDLAWRLARCSQFNTLLWDLDAQGGAGFLLGMDEEVRQRAASVFQRDGKPRQLITPTGYDRLSILQADQSLRGLPVHLARLGLKRRLATMTAFLKPEFERIVIDCPPGFGELSEQVFNAADAVIVPLPPSPLSLRALEAIRMELLRTCQDPPLIVPVLTMYDGRRKLHSDVAKSIATGWPKIPLSSLVEQSAVLRAPLGSFAGGSHPNRAFARLCKDIEDKLGGFASSATVHQMHPIHERIQLRESSPVLQLPSLIRRAGSSL